MREYIKKGVAEMCLFWMTLVLIETNDGIVWRTGEIGISKKQGEHLQQLGCGADSCIKSCEKESSWWDGQDHEWWQHGQRDRRAM